MKTLILATAISATLALAACGPREDPDTTPPEPTAPATTQQSAPTTATSGGQQPPMQQPPAAQPPTDPTMDRDSAQMDPAAERERQLENALRACGELPAEVRGDCEEDARRAADLEDADPSDDDQAGYGQPAPPPRANGE